MVHHHYHLSSCHKAHKAVAWMVSRKLTGNLKVIDYSFFFCAVPLGSIPEMPVESCVEIKASEEGRAVNGEYWLRSRETEMAPNKFVVIVVTLILFFIHLVLYE